MRTIPSVKFLKPPTSLKHIRTITKNGKPTERCYSVGHSADGHILLGCEKGLYHLNSTGSPVYSFKNVLQNIRSVTEHHYAIYMLCQKDGVCKVRMCTPNLKASQKLLKFKIMDSQEAAMTVSDEYIVVSNPEHGELYVYDFISKTYEVANPPIHNNPYFLPDGHLLAVGNDKLAKYSLKKGKLDLVWTCDELPNSGAVCADNNGLIYVLAHFSEILTTKGRIYVVSDKGKADYI